MSACDMFERGRTTPTRRHRPPTQRDRSALNLEQHQERVGDEHPAPTGCRRRNGAISKLLEPAAARKHTLLMYSQSSSPTSLIYTDESRMHSKKQPVSFPFCEHDLVTRRGLRFTSLDRSAPTQGEIRHIGARIAQLAERCWKAVRVYLTARFPTPDHEPRVSQTRKPSTRHGHQHTRSWTWPTSWRVSSRRYRDRTPAFLTRSGTTRTTIQNGSGATRLRGTSRTTCNGDPSADGARGSFGGRGLRRVCSRKRLMIRGLPAVWCGRTTLGFGLAGISSVSSGGREPAHEESELTPFPSFNATVSPGSGVDRRRVGRCALR
jgi:hypothetical protein